MQKRTVLSCLLLFFLMGLNNFLSAQIGGNKAYSFLTLQPNARIAALGGSAIATYENDINLAIQNPALLRASMNKQVGLSHAFYLADIQAGYVTYAWSFDSNQTMAAGLQYVNYGTMEETLDNGVIIGNFTAGDYAFNLAYSRRLDKRLHVGGQFKVIYSDLGTFNSMAIGLDAGITYHNPINLWTFSVALSNLGKQLKTYNGENSEDLPFDIQAGASKKLKNAPFRFSVIAKHLEKPGKLVYQNPNKPSLQKDLETGEIIEEDISIGTKVMSHLNTSAEILLGKSVYVAFGYNYLRRWEMGLKDVSGTTGFSWGFGINLSKFQVAYGSSSYIIGKSTNHLSLILYLNKRT